MSAGSSYFSPGCCNWIARSLFLVSSGSFRQKTNHWEKMEWLKARKVYCEIKHIHGIWRSKKKTNVCSACTQPFCLFLFCSISHLFLHLFCTNKSFILFLTHSPTHNHAALLGQVVRWCFELLMKLAPFLEDKGVGGGVYFQKPKLPLTWGQSFCPSEPCSNLLTLASVSADVI